MGPAPSTLEQPAPLFFLRICTTISTICYYLKLERGEEGKGVERGFKEERRKGRGRGLKEKKGEGEREREERDSGGREGGIEPKGMRGIKEKEEGRRTRREVGRREK